MSSPHHSADASTPPAHVLANGDGSYRVLITDAGTGFSAAGPNALTHWRGDRTADGDGFFIYLRDRDSGAFWSVGRMPVPGAVTHYEARRRPGRFEIARRDHGMEIGLEIGVPPNPPSSSAA